MTDSDEKDGDDESMNMGSLISKVFLTGKSMHGGSAMCPVAMER